MSRLDDLPRANSPKTAPGYDGGNPGIAPTDRPIARREDEENERFWHRPGARPSQGRGGSGDGRSGGSGARRRGRVNVGDGERAVSVAAGAIIGLLGLSRRSLPGLIGAAVGGAMVYRGVTGTCPAYRAMGLDTTGPGRGPAEGLESLDDGAHITTSYGIRKPADELYRFWRNFENLPRIMTHLESVRVIDERRSHWVAKANSLGGKRFEWDAEITADEPDRRIAWRSLPGADVENAGQITFSPGLSEDRGTEVHVRMDYVPPMGRLGHLVASLLGDNPKRVVREDLRNFKRLMEIGEILTIIDQPHGTCTGKGERYTEGRWRPLFT
jgi:uncharacterized membrane protein